MQSNIEAEALEANASPSLRPDSVSIYRSLAYGAPIAGTWFFYIPMWSILPGMYAKYFGLNLTAIAAVVFSIRLFDGVVDTTIGYLSDWHRSRGGSRKTWVFAGCIATIIACYRLFIPPQHTTTLYYLTWSIAFFMAFTFAEIPHITWGSELTMEYQQRTLVFGVRNIMTRVGIVAFYALPLLPLYPSSEYTPEILRDAVYVGTFMTVVGLAFAIFAAPAGMPSKMARRDSLRLLIRSFTANKPLLLYFTSFACMGLAGGMWFGLVYFYLDGYLHLGGRIALMFLVGYAVGALFTPWCLKLIHRTSKSTAWAMGIGLFLAQMAGMAFLTPQSPEWIPFLLIIIVNIYFCCNDTAAMSIIADIVDYGKLKFKKDRGATYFAINILVFKFGLGIGGGLALAVVGWFGFSPAAAAQSEIAVMGLKLAFTVLPAFFAVIGLTLVLRTPIDRRRHGIIQRRLESQQLRQNIATQNG